MIFEPEFWAGAAYGMALGFVSAVLLASLRIRSFEREDEGRDE